MLTMFQLQEEFQRELESLRAEQVRAAQEIHVCLTALTVCIDKTKLL